LSGFEREVPEQLETVVTVDVAVVENGMGSTGNTNGGGGRLGCRLAAEVLVAATSAAAAASASVSPLTSIVLLCVLVALAGISVTSALEGVKPPRPRRSTTADGATLEVVEIGALASAAATVVVAGAAPEGATLREGCGTGLAGLEEPLTGTVRATSSSDVAVDLSAREPGGMRSGSSGSSAPILRAAPATGTEGGTVTRAVTGAGARLEDVLDALA